MVFFRWFSGFIILFCLLALVFRIGGNLINLLLLVAAMVFALDVLMGVKKST